jgi:hypothetical protein
MNCRVQDCGNDRWQGEVHAAARGGAGRPRGASQGMWHILIYLQVHLRIVIAQCATHICM